MKRIFANGDGGGDSFLQAGGLNFVQGVVEGAFTLGAAGINAQTTREVTKSNNETYVEVSKSNNDAKVKITEAWTKFLGGSSKDVVLGIILSIAAIGLIIVLVKKS